MESISLFLDITKVDDFLWKNADISKTQRSVLGDLYIFFGSFLVRYNCVKFHHCRICVTAFREGAFLAIPIRERQLIWPSWIGLTAAIVQNSHIFAAMFFIILKKYCRLNLKGFHYQIWTSLKWSEKWLLSKTIFSTFLKISCFNFMSKLY